MNNKPMFKYAVLALSLILVACTGSGTDESSCREREDGDTLNVLATTPMTVSYTHLTLPTKA